MVVGILKEAGPHERRVAIVPEGVASLISKGMDVLIESGAGESAYYPDKAYQDKGARIATSRSEVLSADVILEIGFPGMEREPRSALLSKLRSNQIVIGLLNPLSDIPMIEQLASRGVTSFALELLPRITRAQNMDVLSSLATVTGYAAVILAAQALPRFFPMLMTAAGTVTPARVFIIGAGVAGLQAIATARRLGAVVHAYDVRPAVRQEVQSLGAKFVELEIGSTAVADANGYARAMDERFLARQRELMGRTLAHSDVVISTAAVPGKKAPVLITREMVSLMPPGSVIVDLAAEQGGNCELTRAGETVVEHDVKIIGPVNLSSTVPVHASQMYSRNVTSFLLHLLKENPDGLRTDRFLSTEEPITHDTLITADGHIVHPRVKELLNKPAPLLIQKEIV